MWIVVLVALPVLYVLSLGPVVWINRWYGPFDDGLQYLLELFYYPLRLLVDSEVPVVVPALEWYVELFVE